jgi:hypothetical protein
MQLLLRVVVVVVRIGAVAVVVVEHIHLLQVLQLRHTQ